MNSSEILSCRDLTIGYSSKKGGEKKVSEDLNLKLNKGEIISLIGPNGSGKSTLIRTLTGIQPPLKGEVYIKGRDIRTFSPEEKAKTLSVVLTTPVQAGNLTAFDIVALGRYPYTNWAGTLTDDDEKIVLDALGSTGAKNLAYRFIHELSDGERQKVMIARAVAQDPDLMVLDEPTAFLDFPHKIETMRVLKEVAHHSGRTILLSTHDLNLAIRCSDRLLIMKNNGDFKSGTPEDLILSGDLESAFNLGGVLFDRKKGDFTIPVKNRGEVFLKGEHSIEYIWTVNALERLGVKITGESENSCNIFIDRTGENTKWIFNQNKKSGQVSCENIEELVMHLLDFFKEGDNN